LTQIKLCCAARACFPRQGGRSPVSALLQDARDLPGKALAVVAREVHKVRAAVALHFLGKVRTASTNTWGISGPDQRKP